MAKEGGGVWKLILIEVGVAVLAVLGKEIADRTAEYLANKSKQKSQESDEKSESKEAPESPEPEKDPSKSAKTQGENGTS
jgi:DNA replication initiation complex subunit (GINS family)